MNNLLLKIKTLLFLIVLLLSAKSELLSAPCNWKSNNPTFLTWDSCSTNQSPKASVQGYINFNSNIASCFKYIWRVNGTVVSNAVFFNQSINQNGTYSICLKVTDTCNNCDTTFCINRTISCLPNSCNFKSSVIFQGIDSCNGMGNPYSINGFTSISNNNCFIYQWYVNNTLIKNGGSRFHYPINKNGNYTLCFKVTDTCRKCDTTFCASFSITCIPPACNWKARNHNSFVWDSCNNQSGKTSINAYIAFNYNNVGCLKYQWTVNNINAGNSNILYYPITTNGNYSICVKVTDTCKSCDTTYCFTKTITCFKECQLGKKGFSFFIIDSCNGRGYKYSTNGFFISQISCLKYEWKVNGVLVSTFEKFSYPITKNGNYTICLKVTDTCNNCDTTLCQTRLFSCIKNTCKGIQAIYTVTDTCQGIVQKNMLFASFLPLNGNSNCYLYQWSVNNTIINTNNNFVYYPITSNGSYTIQVKIIDTCNNCDTMFSETRTFNCFTGCNWKSRIDQIKFADSCNGIRYKYSTNGYMSMKQHPNNGCLKYTWRINNVLVSNQQFFNRQMFNNNVMNYCVNIRDTCSNCDTSICQVHYFYCQDLGIHSSAMSLKISLSPIPVTDGLTIKNELGVNETKIVDMHGKTLWKGQLAEGDNTISTSTWSSGIYFVFVYTNSGTVTHKFIKE